MLRAVRIAAAFALAGLTAACFQPLYGERSLDGGPGYRATMSAVDIGTVTVANPNMEGRLAVELRNALLFEQNGGGPREAPPAYRIDINLSSTRVSVVVDVTTARPELENYGINASYKIVDLRTGKIILTGDTFSRVSYDIPGQQQRFARQRAARDAESRAVLVIAQQIRTRLASFVVTGS